MIPTLYPRQAEAATRMATLLSSGTLCVVNASDTGTGKTLMAYDALRQTGRRALVICPKPAKAVWQFWAGEFEMRDRLIDTVNPEILVRGKHSCWDGKQWHLSNDTLVIVDEFHKGCSGAESKMTKAIALLKAYRIPVIAQSATIASSPLQMRALGYLLDLHRFTRESYFEWCGRNGCTRAGRGLPWEFHKHSPKAIAAMDALHKQLADRMIRLKLSDIPGTPQGILESKLFTLDKYATDEINAAYKEAAAEIRLHNATDPRVFLGKCRQRTEIAKIPLLVDLVEEGLEEDNSVVVFVNFVRTVEMLKEALAKHSPCVIYGSGPSDPTGEKRAADIARFQRNETFVAIVQTQAGGVAVSLHDVLKTRPRRSYLTPPYSASDARQCLGRIHRVGGTDVVQTFVMVDKTVEVGIHKSLLAKLRCMDALQDGDLQEKFEQ